MPFKIPNSKYWVNWFSALAFENGVIEYRFDPALKPFLLNLKENFTSYYLTGHESGEYKIREHKAKGLMLPEVKEQKFRADITMATREAHANVSDF